MKSGRAVIRGAAVLALFLVASGSACAAGAARHGPVLQGIRLNGPVLQGVAFNGPVLQGVHFNGPVLQGLNFNGPVLQGMRLNGPVLQGMRLNGTQVQGPLPLTAAFEPSGDERAMYGLGQGVFRTLPGAADDVRGHSPASGLDARHVRVRRVAS